MRLRLPKFHQLLQTTCGRMPDYRPNLKDKGEIHAEFRDQCPDSRHFSARIPDRRSALVFIPSSQGEGLKRQEGAHPKENQP
jgi:hypothetical protein